MITLKKLHIMKEVAIPLIFPDIEEVRSYKDRNLVMHWKNGDRVTIQKGPEAVRLRKFLIRQFSGDHIDK